MGKSKNKYNNMTKDEIIKLIQQKDEEERKLKLVNDAVVKCADDIKKKLQNLESEGWTVKSIEEHRIDITPIVSEANNENN